MNRETAEGTRSSPVLMLLDIQKSFGGINALSGISFDLFPGEVHALVGENGAGKSTLMKIISGGYKPDHGTIELDGADYDSFSPEQAHKLGISIVYQEFTLLPELSVSENIFIADQPLTKFGIIDVRKRNQLAGEILNRLGSSSEIRPDTLVRDLTVGEQQIVEIAKALALNARILIMDEPSAVLPSNDLERLFSIIRALRNEGTSIIYISHRLKEIFEVADRVTVLRDGQSVETKNVADTNDAELVRLMVGRTLADMYPPRNNKIGIVLLEASGLNIEDTVFDINFQVHEGEVLGISGLGGSGRTTIARSLVGLAKINGGKVVYLDKDRPKNPEQAARAGLVLIPEDRHAYGLVLNQNLGFNISLPNLVQFQSAGVIRKKLEKNAVQQVMKSMQVRPQEPNAIVENLSGGNQQKVVLAKWLLNRTKVVIFDEPTRGIDVGAKAEIYQHIRNLTLQGVGVILASSDLPELLGMSDRILVLHEGRLAGELSYLDATEEKIMQMATGTMDNGEILKEAVE